jgi:hypothetical protein
VLRLIVRLFLHRVASSREAGRTLAAALQSTRSSRQKPSGRARLNGEVPAFCVIVYSAPVYCPPRSI